MKFFLYKNTGELLRRIHHHQRGREGSSEQGSCSALRNQLALKALGMEGPYIIVQV